MAMARSSGDGGTTITDPLAFITGNIDANRSFTIDFNCGIQGRAPAGGGTLGVCEPVIGNKDGVTDPVGRSLQTVAKLFINQYSGQTDLKKAALLFQTLPEFYGAANDQASSADQLQEIALNLKGDDSIFINSFGFLPAAGISLENGSGPGKQGQASIANAVNIKSYGQAGGGVDAFDLLLKFGNGNSGVVIPEPGQTGNPLLLGAISFGSDFAPNDLFNAFTQQGYPPLLGAYKLVNSVAVVQEKSNRTLLDQDLTSGLATGNDRTRSQNYFGADAPTAVPLESDLAGALGIASVAFWAYRRSRQGNQASLQLD